MPTLMMQLRALLETPNPDDPLNAEIAAQYTSDKEAHDAKAREVTAAGESY
jgi:ubiquitin-protein ligase